MILLKNDEVIDVLASPPADFSTLPQCGQNVLYVACIQSQKSTSFYMYPKVKDV